MENEKSKIRRQLDILAKNGTTFHEKALGIFDEKPIKCSHREDNNVYIMNGDKDYRKKIRQASNAYLKYLDHIRELESMANDIIKDSPLYEYLDSPITCERFPDSGLSFIIELNNDGGMPHTVTCISFFELFKNGPEYVTTEELKKISF